MDDAERKRFKIALLIGAIAALLGVGLLAYFMAQGEWKSVLLMGFGLGVTTIGSLLGAVGQNFGNEFWVAHPGSNNQEYFEPTPITSGFLTGFGATNIMTIMIFWSRL